ncbi:hypothetical protein [Planctomyces sp. SH-PL62]|uniref:hypothetical protein n=1 Tax=Planctomyces sp. SH-PL62 TaxID=1636152 RepID=UPI00078E8511|nr:hypothetical protein [Planctomyces sp. SH-PL62]AMV37629.1 hypothetical protein VT85_09340 [Planctomyces sp. SH-PL62]
MWEVLCEVGAGLRPSERTVAVPDVYGNRHHLRVEAGFIAEVDGKAYIPVGMIGVDEAKQLALVELPHESDAGINRLWVWQANLHKIEAASGAKAVS